MDPVVDAGTEVRRGWQRAALLFFVVLALASPFGPMVLIGVPLLVLIGIGGIRSLPAFVVTVLTMVVILLGSTDDLWYLERAWALVAGGIFAALAVGTPSWSLVSRALAAVGGTVAVFAAYLGLRPDGWQSVDWSVTGTIEAGYHGALDLMILAREGQALDPVFVTSMMWLKETTIHVFPARLALQTVGALAAAWWVYLRIVRSDERFGSLRQFRFNDHLVWLMIAGLAILAVRPLGGVGRLGANLAVFMGGLYALRGLGVFIFLNGGLSLIGVTLVTIGLFFFAPLLVGFMLIIGVADTWLDVRTRVSAAAG